MKFFFFDTETTGTDPNTDRIIQFGGILGSYSIKTRKFKEIERINQFINVPVRIPEGASNVHHIYNRDLVGYDYIDSYIDKFLTLIEEADYVVGHNVNFDKNMLVSECKRVGIDFDRNNVKFIDTMRPTTNIVKISNGRGGYKYPKLIELHKFLFNRGFDGAHDAMADITATKDCFIELLNNYGLYQDVFEEKEVCKSISKEKSNNENDFIKKDLADGTTYIGGWDNGKPNGFGRFGKDGEPHLIGEVKNGVVSGFIETFNKETGNINFIGEFHDGRIDGVAKFFRKNGTVTYVGEYLNGHRHGFGVMYSETGVKIYEGSWSEGKANGLGIMYHENGKKEYEGFFKDGQFHGHGTSYYENGKKEYEGTWLAGSRHGHGTAYDKKGKAHKGARILGGELEKGLY